MKGSRLPWRVKGRGLADIREQLDRVIVSVDWRTKFANAGVINLNAH